MCPALQRRLIGEQLTPAGTRRTCAGPGTITVTRRSVLRQCPMAGEANWGQASPGGAVWRDKGCSELEGTPSQQLRTLVDLLREMEIRCARCQVRHVGTCRKCHIGRCTQCQQAEERFKMRRFDKIHVQSRWQRRGALSTCIGWKEKERCGGDQEC